MPYLVSIHVSGKRQDYTSSVSGSGPPHWRSSQSCAIYFCWALAAPAESCNHNLLNNQLLEHKASLSTNKEPIFLYSWSHVSSPEVTVYGVIYIFVFPQGSSANRLLKLSLVETGFKKTPMSKHNKLWDLQIKPCWLTAIGNTANLNEAGLNCDDSLGQQTFLSNEETWPICRCFSFTSRTHFLESCSSMFKIWPASRFDSLNRLPGRYKALLLPETLWLLWQEG